MIRLTKKISENMVHDLLMRRFETDGTRLTAAWAAMQSAAA